MDSKSLKLSSLGFLVLFAFSLTGCPPKKEIIKEEPKKEEEVAKPPEEPSLRGKEYQEVPEISAVYFDLDQASLRSDAMDTLKKNYEALSKHANWEALVEGHCDERGTTEYNLGLGQRRASAIRKYYITLGLDGARVATISYGKEKPICMQHAESCWSQNRRGMTKVRAMETK